MRITKSAVALAGAFLVALLCANPITASAQAWPAKSVRIVVPFVPGGGSDIQGRLFSKKFQESMRQSFVVDNRGGTTSHLAIEMLKQQAGIDVVHIPYKGGSSAMIAMMAGEVDFRFTTALASLQHIRAGRVRPLAVGSAQKFVLLPELPTLASFYPGFEADNWYAMFLPGGTPREIVTRLNAEVQKALNSPDMRDAITKDGGEPKGSTPDELAAYFKREVDKYAKVIRAGKVQAE